MIAHVSLPALDCAFVANVLARMLGGGALRFPPGGPDAWNCWSRENDFQIVVTPRGRVIVPGEHGQEWSALPERERPEPLGYESHVAIAVPLEAREVVELARSVGWRVGVFSRGGMFEVVEVWVENVYLVELLDPRQMADYRRTMTVDNWRRAFGLE
ncbi:MAG TPA: hypothetical protein VFQ35_02735 [Polyangiaceae bacterium]|nr:hypothetical protein [Polyangiaceae bacterium]